MIYLLLAFTILYRLLCPSALLGITPLFALFFVSNIRNINIIFLGSLLCDMALSFKHLTPYCLLPSCAGLLFYAIPKQLNWLIGGAFIQYLIANTVSFFTSPYYAKTFNSWIECNFTGNLNYPPSYLFLAKSILGTLIFSIIFSYVLKLESSPQKVACHV